MISIDSIIIIVIIYHCFYVSLVDICMENVYYGCHSNGMELYFSIIKLSNNLLVLGKSPTLMPNSMQPLSIQLIYRMLYTRQKVLDLSPLGGSKAILQRNVRDVYLGIFEIYKIKLSTS